jgi:xylulokinase
MSLLGIDIGTTGAKVILLEEDGTISANVTEEYETSTPSPLWSEQKPGDWWNATCAGVKKALEASGKNNSDIKGVGVSGQMVGLVLLDRGGKPLRPCIMWNDQRSVKEVEDLTAQIGLETILAETSNPMFASFVVPKLEWVRRNEPDVYAEVRHVLLPKDYITYMLTGNVATEVSDASGTCLLNMERRAWSDAMVSALGIPKEWLPRCVESDEIIGEVTSEAATATGLLHGTPVVGGAGDQPAQSLGCGIVKPGLCSVTVGTSGVVFAQADRHIRHPEGLLHAFCHSVRGQWYVMGVMLSAGGSFQWLRDTLSAHGQINFDQLTGLAKDVPPGSDGLIFLPYLSGERMPYDDPLARGGWIGLTQRHSLSHLVRAVMEGITFGLYDLLQIIRGLGMDIQSIYASGGASESRLWRQMLADIFNARIITTNATQGAAFGAAMLAGIGAGIFKDAAEATEATIVVTGSTDPNQQTHEVYARAFDLYRSLYPQLKGSFQEMAEFSSKKAE